MTGIIQKALDAISRIRNHGDADEWVTETTGVRYGVRYTDATRDDALVDEGWTDKATATARRKALRAEGATRVYVVKITTRWRRRPRKVPVEKAQSEPTPEAVEA
ncbi:MAG: hypothetical protein ABJE95_18395 [Byssovorax sp.]